MQNNTSHPYLIFLEVALTWSLAFIGFITTIMPLIQFLVLILAALVSLKALGVFRFIKNLTR